MTGFDRVAWRVVDVAIFLAILGMVILIAIQVGSRLVGYSAPWTEELSRFLFFWTTYLGLAAGFRRGLHPSFDLVWAALPPAGRRLSTFVTPAAALVFFGVVTVQSIGLIRQQIAFGEISPILQVGMWVTTLPLALGTALAIFGAFMHALDLARPAVPIPALGEHP